MGAAAERTGALPPLEANRLDGGDGSHELHSKSIPVPSPLVILLELEGY